MDCEKPSCLGRLVKGAVKMTIVCAVVVFAVSGFWFHQQHTSKKWPWHDWGGYWAFLLAQGADLGGEVKVAWEGTRAFAYAKSKGHAAWDRIGEILNRKQAETRPVAREAAAEAKAVPVVNRHYEDGVARLRSALELYRAAVKDDDQDRMRLAYDKMQEARELLEKARGEVSDPAQVDEILGVVNQHLHDITKESRVR